MIIDKGTLDAMLCSDDAFINVAKMLKECQRTIKVGGYYVVVSFSAPENRQSHLVQKHLNWKLNIVYTSKYDEEKKEDIKEYLYICQKVKADDKENIDRVFQEVLDEIKTKS